MPSCDFCWSFMREPARRVGAGPFGARLASAFRTAPSNGRGRCGRHCLSAVVIRAIASPEAEPRDGLPCPASEDSQATPCGSAWPRTPPPIHRFFFPFLFFFVPCRPPPLRAAFSATRVASALAGCSVGLLVLPFRGRTAASAVSRRFCFGAASPGEPRAVSRPVSPPHARARARPPRRTRVCYLGGDAALGGIFRGAIMVLESAGGAAGGAARPRAVTKGE